MDEVPLVHMLEKKVLVSPRCFSIEKSLSRAGDEPYVDLQKIAEDGSLPFQSQDPLVILEIKRAFCQLLRKHCADELKDEVQPGGSSIEVFYLLLSQEVPMLAIWLADDPKTLLPLFAEAATELWACPIRHVRVSGLPLDDKLQDLCESHRDALVKVCRRRCARAAHALPLVLPCTHAPWLYRAGNGESARNLAGLLFKPPRAAQDWRPRRRPDVPRVLPLYLLFTAPAMTTRCRSVGRGTPPHVRARVGCAPTRSAGPCALPPAGGFGERRSVRVHAP